MDDTCKCKKRCATKSCPYRKISLVAAGAMLEEAAAILLQQRIAHFSMSSLY